MTPAERLAAAGITYPPRLPATATEIPEGSVIAHNWVTPARQQGTRGFRFWYQRPAANLGEPCPCPWAPELGAHYCPAAHRRTEEAEPR